MAGPSYDDDDDDEHEYVNGVCISSKFLPKRRSIAALIDYINVVDLEILSQ